MDDDIRDTTYDRVHIARNLIAAGFDEETVLSQLDAMLLAAHPFTETDYLGAVGSYYGDSLQTVFIGDCAEVETNEAGAIGSVAFGATGLDVYKDVADLGYGFAHFEFSLGWFANQGLNLIGVVPLLGMAKNLKHADEVGELEYLDDVPDVPSRPSQLFSSEKADLVDMAKRDKAAGGITSDDMEAYKELNKGLPDPFPETRVRGPETHPTRPHGSSPHGHVGPVEHIPIK